MPFPWGAALGFGGNLLSAASGLFGSKKEDNYHPEVWRKDMYRDYDYQVRAVVDSAKKYGFHPLALLGAGLPSSGGFAQPVSSYGPSNAALAGDAIGDALNAFGDLYDQNEQLEKDEADRERERALAILRSKEITPEMKLQRENMGLQNDLLRMDILRSREEIRAARAASVGAVTGSPSVVDPNSGQLVVGPNLIPNLRRGATVSGQEAADMYGDLIGEAYGVGNYLDDVFETHIKPLGKSAWEWYIEPFSRLSASGTGYKSGRPQ